MEREISLSGLFKKRDTGQVFNKSVFFVHTCSLFNSPKRMFFSKYILNGKCIFATILVLLAVNAFSLNLGYISPSFSRFLGFISLVAVLILYSNQYKIQSANRDFILGISLIFISLALLFISLSQVFWLISLPIFISGVDLIQRSSNNKVNELPALSLGSLIYAIIYIGYLYLAIIHEFIWSLSQFSTNSISLTAGVPFNIGPTISGILVFLAFISCSLGFLILSENSNFGYNFKIFLAITTAVAISYIVFLLILTAPQMTDARIMDSIYMAFFLPLVPFILLVGKFKLRYIPSGQFAVRKMDALLLTTIIILSVSISISPHIYDGRPGKVVIYERDTEMGFDIPQFPKGNEPFEPYRGFSVGALGLFLRSIGYDVEELNDTNPHTLKDALKDSDILVLLNLKKPFGMDDVEYIRSFVENGGGLFVFGEHTRMFVEDEDFKSGRDYLNDVLWPAGISINSDTADYAMGHWKYANLPTPHYVTKSLGLDVSTSSVGASLSLNGSANPLIIGRYAFSDNPNPNELGHLGNRTYERGERLGDLVLGAYGYFGDGKILVIGDTSYIFNTETPFRYNFIRDSISWLMSEESSYLILLRLFSLILLGILLVLYLSGKRALPRYSIALQVFISIIIAISLAISGVISSNLINVQEKENAGINFAFIDQSHSNRFNSINYNPDSIDGLIINLMRNGYMPLVLKENKDLSGLKPNDTFIIIAPTVKYSPKEISYLSDFVKNGGLLIISAGYSNAASLDKLLKQFDIYINETPLGAVPWIVDTHGTGGVAVVAPDNLKKFWHEPKFLESHPVGSQGDFEPLAWLTYQGIDYSLIIAKDYGAGEIILIGDSRFLLNENLEYLTPALGLDKKEQYQLQWLGNIELLREIIARHRGVRA